jgi:eukaryotic-like serine/threonine-protein kinase
MSAPDDTVYEFGPFRLDTAQRLLLRDGCIIPLQPRPFDILLALVRNSHRVVLKGDLMSTVWGKTVVEESNLSQNIFVLRKALGDAQGGRRYIITVPGRGYRFAETVRLTPEIGVPVPQGPLEEPPLGEAQNAPHSPTRPKRPSPHLYLGAAAAVFVLAAAGGGYLHFKHARRLTDQDTIVLADFTNSTGDAVFDDTLKTALRVSLRQSPFLNLLSDSEGARILQQMTRPPNTKLTPELARELCLRAGSKAYVAGSIGTLGQQYVLGLTAVNCQSRDPLAQELVTATAKENVLDALGTAASKLRSELGESLATVQKFDVPLERATTSSLEALQAYSLSAKVSRQKGAMAALPYGQRALDLDPNFALGYWAMGLDYANMGELGRSSEYFTKAFQLREHASEREKLWITAYYYRDVTGELGKSAQTSQEAIATFPRDPAAYDYLGGVLGNLGQYEKAAVIAAEAVRLLPDAVVPYENLANDALALQHFDEARAVIQQAQGRQLDDAALHNALYGLAFLRADSAAMAEQQQWFAGQLEYESWGLALGADTEAFAGRLDAARALTRRAVQAAVRDDDKENAAVYLTNAAVLEAAYGNTAEARHLAAESLKLAPGSANVAAEAALAFALAGDPVQAETLTKDLAARYPWNTHLQSLWLPTIQAGLALYSNHPAAALNALQAASSVDLAQIPFVNNLSCLYSVYLRGTAQLELGHATAAAAEFQRVLDHSGIVWNCWTGALADLGVARANAFEAKHSQGAGAEAARVGALAHYQAFFKRWANADPDIPILKSAKAEYLTLRGG